MHVIGTAGHVDHGKSALVQALTGVDPDRWREEKERGLTIDLGFAQLTSSGGSEASIVDVPGHERFIKNMLAGVGGIDLALLVIAADEGVMPQTREHLAILDLLGVSHGVVALTKADLVDAGGLDAARAAAAEAIAGTTLAGSPVVSCSSVTRVGLDELVAAIEAQLVLTPRRRDIGWPRLSIDRSFTMTGFGTVVTGTLIDGSLEVGAEVELIPGGARARIRGIQNHGTAVEVAEPGRRTAVNLSGIAVEDLKRGMVLVLPGMVAATTAVDVRLRVASHLDRIVRHDSEVTFHTGAAEVAGRLLLLDADAVRPGESAWAQLRFSEPVVALRGDRFIVRDPNDTLGGGVVVDVDVRRHRRFHPVTIAALQVAEGGTPLERLVRAIGSAASAADSVRTRIEEAIASYHHQWPLRRGIPREELRGQVGLSVQAFNAIVQWLATEGVVAAASAVVALPTHRPELPPSQQRAAATYLAALRAVPYAPPTEGKPDAEVLGYLEAERLVVNAGDGVVFVADAYDTMVARIEGHLREHGALTLAQVRDMFGTSRRYAQALLEHLDARRVTRRVGDERVLFAGKK